MWCAPGTLADTMSLVWLIAECISTASSRLPRVLPTSHAMATENPTTWRTYVGNDWPNWSPKSASPDMKNNGRCQHAHTSPSSRLAGASPNRWVRRGRAEARQPPPPPSAPPKMPATTIAMITAYQASPPYLGQCPSAIRSITATTTLIPATSPRANTYQRIGTRHSNSRPSSSRTPVRPSVRAVRATAVSDGANDPTSSSGSRTPSLTPDISPAEMNSTQVIAYATRKKTTTSVTGAALVGIEGALGTPRWAGAAGAAGAAGVAGSFAAPAARREPLENVNRVLLTAASGCGSDSMWT